MLPMADRTYRVREFAALAGVTVRALHHYDRLGLLRPKRSGSGYRVYNLSDLEVLEQIVALKFIGLPLNRIKKLLRRDRTEIVTALRAQRALLEEKKQLLERAIAAVGEAERTLQAGHDVGSETFKRIIEVIEMHNNDDTWNAKYESMVAAKLERLKAMSAETKAKLKEDWSALLRDIAGALDEDPGSPKAQQLADRWVQLLGAFSPNAAALDPEVLRRFGAAYRFSEAYREQAGASAWQPAERPETDKRLWDFITKALAVRA